MIGLVTSRFSGILASRDAYLDTLRTIMPCDSVGIAEAKRRECRINLFAGAMSLKTLEQMGPRPGKNIWCLVLESTALPLKAMEVHKAIDQVWVPTQFCLDVCLRNGMDPKKVHLVPYFIRQPLRHIVRPKHTDPFTILTSWDGKSSMNRKFVLGAIEAFKEAWPTDLSVRLRLKTRELDEGNTTLLHNAIAGDARIFVDDRFLETTDDLFDGVHCIFHPHRAEGYGRHLLEAMQRRVPVIATAYSGNMDWMTATNSLLINYSIVDTAQKEFQYPQGGRWALPDVAHAVHQLRYCRDNYERLRPMLDYAEQDAFRAAGLERCRSHMLEALKSL